MHIETGVITVGQSGKNRLQNQKEALERMANHYKVRAFLESKLIEVENGVSMAKQAEAYVKEAMEEENFKEIPSEKDWKLMTKGMKKETIEGVEVWT